MNSAAAEKRQILQAVTFGKPTAEEEGADLSAYFVETDQWQRLFAGDIDVVYGPKGSGKSALYSLLLSRTSELFDRGIIIVAAENPRGAVAFRDLVANPPANEAEFRNLWKLFFLVLVAHTLREYGISSPHLRKVIEPLEEARLLPRAVLLLHRRPQREFALLCCSSCPNSYFALRAVDWCRMSVCRWLTGWRSN